MQAILILGFVAGIAYLVSKGIKEKAQEIPKEVPQEVPRDDMTTVLTRAEKNIAGDYITNVVKAAQKGNATREMLENALKLAKTYGFINAPPIINKYLSAMGS